MGTTPRPQVLQVGTGAGTGLLQVVQMGEGAGKGGAGGGVTTGW